MNGSNGAFWQFLNQPGIVLVLTFWLIFWEGWALWKAATKRQLVWFILLLLTNTLGLLEMAYVLYLNRWDLDKGKLLAFLEKKFKKEKKKD
jgi:uncharacterized membrane protein